MTHTHVYITVSCDNIYSYSVYPMLQIETAGFVVYTKSYMYIYRLDDESMEIRNLESRGP